LLGCSVGCHLGRHFSLQLVSQNFLPDLVYFFLRCFHQVSDHLITHFIHRELATQQKLSRCKSSGGNHFIDVSDSENCFLCIGCDRLLFQKRRNTRHNTEFRSLKRQLDFWGKIDLFL